MSALAQSYDRRCSGGIVRKVPLLANALPFQGSLMGLDSTGYYKPLVAGIPFAGISTKTILAKDSPAVSGQFELEIVTENPVFIGVIAGLTIADVVAQRKVYASTDNDLTLTAEAGNTYIGKIIGLATQFGGITNGVFIQAETFHLQGMGAERDLGSQVLADAPATLTVSQLDMTLYLPNTAARTLTLPPVASCTGRKFKVIKTNAAAFAITLQGNAAETINGSNTYATATANYSYAEIRSDGTQWVLVGKI